MSARDEHSLFCTLLYLISHDSYRRKSATESGDETTQAPAEEMVRVRLCAMCLNACIGAGGGKGGGFAMRSAPLGSTRLAHSIAPLSHFAQRVTTRKEPSPANTRITAVINRVKPNNFSASFKTRLAGNVEMAARFVPTYLVG